VISNEGGQTDITPRLATSCWGRKTLEVMISIPPPETIVSVASLSATTLYQINSDRKHRPCNITSSLFHTVVSVTYERYMVSVEYFLKLFKVTTTMVVNGVKYS